MFFNSRAGRVHPHTNITGYRSNGVMAIFREWSDADDEGAQQADATDQGWSRAKANSMKSHLTACLPAQNCVTLTYVPQNSCDLCTQ